MQPKKNEPPRKKSVSFSREREVFDPTKEETRVEAEPSQQADNEYRYEASSSEALQWKPTEGEAKPEERRRQLPYVERSVYEAAKERIGAEYRRHRASNLYRNEYEETPFARQDADPYRVQPVAMQPRRSYSRPESAAASLGPEFFHIPPRPSSSDTYRELRLEPEPGRFTPALPHQFRQYRLPTESDDSEEETEVGSMVHQQQRRVEELNRAIQSSEPVISGDLQYEYTWQREYRRNVARSLPNDFNFMGISGYQLLSKFQQSEIKRILLGPYVAENYSVRSNVERNLSGEEEMIEPNQPSTSREHRRWRMSRQTEEDPDAIKQFPDEFDDAVAGSSQDKAMIDRQHDRPQHWGRRKSKTKPKEGWLSFDTFFKMCTCGRKKCDKKKCGKK